MAVTTTKTNKPINPRGNDQSPKGYNRAALYSGKALDFDGVNDSIDLGTGILTGTGDFTYCGYVKNDNQSLYGHVFGNYNQGNLQILYGKRFIGLYLGNNSCYLGESPWTTDLEEYTDDWVFLTALREGTETRFYMNGVLMKTGSSSSSIGDSSDLFKIGATTNNAAYFDGQISNTRAFDVALTQAQILDLYNNPEKIVPTGVEDTALKLWLPMMEGAGTTAYDGSGNGNHGTISGATWTHGVGSPVAQTAVIDWNKGINSFTYSEDFSNADWITIDVTKVSTSETDYIGGNTAANITWLAGSPRYFYQNIEVSGASTLSFYVKSNGGGNKFRLFGNGTLAMGSDMTATSEWVRYDFEFTGNASQGIGITQASDNSAADLLVCFAQVETNASVGPYVRTGATAQTSPVLLPQGLTSGRDITGVNLFENVRKQGALNLDGNSWAEVHDNASLDITDEVTLECWLYHTDTTNLEHIIGKRASSGDWLRIYSASTNTLRVERALGAATSNVSITENAWSHIVATIDTSDVVRFYVNGTQQTSAASFTPWSMSNAAPVSIGAWVTESGAVSSNSYETGAIAQPRIYNRALTAEEVERNYNAGKNIYK